MKFKWQEKKGIILMFIERGSELIDETNRVHGKHPDFCLFVGSGGRQAVDGKLAEGWRGDLEESLPPEPDSEPAAGILLA